MGARESVGPTANHARNASLDSLTCQMCSPGLYRRYILYVCKTIMDRVHPNFDYSCQSDSDKIASLIIFFIYPNFLGDGRCCNFPPQKNTNNAHVYLYMIKIILRHGKCLICECDLVVIKKLVLDVTNKKEPCKFDVSDFIYCSLLKHKNKYI